MKVLPENVHPYKRTSVFTQATIPAGLLKNHKTGESVWGLIQVQEGRLEYVIENKEFYILEPGNHGVVEPEISHHVRPLGSVSFFIEFYK